jgi:hypothetical protein
MKLVGAGEQQLQHFFFDQSGTITTGGTPQVILPVQPSRSVLLVQNLSVNDMYMQLGSATATCTISGGKVNSVTVTNAGFNFSKPPVVRFYGGGSGGNSSYIGRAAPGAAAPSNFAQAHAVMTGSAPNQSVSSITIDNGGSGYVIAPFVFIMNSDLDPYGCADPSLSSGNGILLPASGGSYYMNGTGCPTDSVALYSASSTQRFTCKYMT